MTAACPDGQVSVGTQCVFCNNPTTGIVYCARCYYDTNDSHIKCTECEQGYRFLNTVQSGICVRSSIFNLSGTEFTFLALFGVALTFALIILSVWFASWIRQRRAIRATRERANRMANKTLYIT
ncbi:Hypothetical protein GLP15_3489 [Giardia lamblia P15]|uniref:High cysteine membrane protein n=1 Tax=Giardia intestinalis (strain P15) TaxID=658858 RepID=E1F0F9_GIAIA|nr:Hypothetical protein GLP15_3489 [Giardia lamblia P15]